MVVAIPVDEYERWLPPSAALKELEPIERGTIIDALTACIRTGSIRTAARQIFELKSERFEQVGIYILLDPGRWINQAEERFWAFGTITVEPEPIMGVGAFKEAVSPGARPTLELNGVRLDPVGIAVLANQHGVAKVAQSASMLYPISDPPVDPPYRAKPKARPKDSVPKATHAELKEWLAVWAPDNPDATFPEVMKAAEAAISIRRITRQPLRDVIGELKMTKSRGNPAIRRKNGE